MSKLEKLKARLKSKPKDFEYKELKTLLEQLGFEEIAGSGSRRKFTKEGYIAISLHEPHPTGILKAYQVKQIVEYLENNGLI
jgi:predicted RNA binding protein YcfA (HicA-like mRNA interferase family)